MTQPRRHFPTNLRAMWVWCLDYHLYRNRQKGNHTMTDRTEQEAYETVVAARNALWQSRINNDPQDVQDALQRRYLDTLQTVYGSAPHQVTTH